MAQVRRVARAWAVRALWSFVLLVATAISYLWVGTLLAQRRTAVPDSRRDALGDTVAVNPFASANGTHLIAFVITASDCGWSRQPQAMEAVGSLRAKLRASYGDKYAQVRVVAVSLDEDLEVGLAFLADIGKGSVDSAFDQLIIGGSWLNEQVVRFVWRERLIEAASPQVIVVERSVSTDSYLSNFRIGIQDDRVMANPVGSQQVVNWILEGMPLDQMSVERSSGTGSPSVRP